MQKILITGGGGFIGSNIAAALASQHHITLCDRFGQDEKWINIRQLPLAEIILPDQLDEWLKTPEHHPDIIIHMGAISATTERDIDAIITNNLQLSQQLWHWSSKHHTPLIYASSAATYGDGSKGFEDTEDVDYLLSLKPLNGYAWSKWLFDIWAIKEAANGNHPPHWAGLKFFNVYGPHEHHKGDMKSVICKMFPDVIDEKPVKLFTSHHPDYKDGGQLRDFVYVQDCVSVVKWLMEHKDVSGLFNVGTGKARSFFDLATATHVACGKEPKIEYIPMPPALRRKYQYFTEANMSKLRGAGYDIPATSLEDGVKNYIQQLTREAQ